MTRPRTDAKPSRKAQLLATRPTVGAYATRDTLRLRISFLSPAWMKALTPHAEGHWRSKASPTAWLRAEVADACRSAWAWPTMEQATMRYIFVFPDSVRRDEANLIQRLKPAIDGIVDAGVIVGDHWQVLSNQGVESSINKHNPRVEVVVGRVG